MAIYGQANWEHPNSAAASFNCGLVACRSEFVSRAGFSADPFWHGPKPTPDMLLKVSLVGDERTWTVQERKALSLLVSEDVLFLAGAWRTRSSGISPHSSMFGSAVTSSVRKYGLAACSNSNATLLTRYR